MILWSRFVLKQVEIQAVGISSTDACWNEMHSDSVWWWRCFGASKAPSFHAPQCSLHQEHCNTALCDIEFHRLVTREPKGEKKDEKIYILKNCSYNCLMILHLSVCQLAGLKGIVHPKIKMTLMLFQTCFVVHTMTVNIHFPQRKVLEQHDEN